MGGSGTVYVDCADVTRALLLDNKELASSGEMVTNLVDSGMTSYSFDHVKLLNKVKLGFAPADVASSTVSSTTAKRQRERTTP